MDIGVGGWPTTLAINAWTGEPGPTESEIAADGLAWALRTQPARPQRYLQPEPDADLRDWGDPRVGWGLVLPDNDAIPEADRTVGADAPEPIRALLQARAPGPVLRYRAELAPTHIRRYYLRRGPQDLAISGSGRGIGEGQLPRYLLLYGTPEKIPWSFQYVLNSACYVGRLHLYGEALGRYVDALLGGWAAACARPTHPVVWAPDLGSADITHLMRMAITAPVHEALAGDDDIGRNVRYLGADGDATVADLGKALAGQRPALVVTTSHGMTGPLDDPAAMARDLGLLVGEDYELVRPERLLAGWQPDGAIWYAHACCSAGAAAVSNFHGLFPPGSRIDRLLTEVAALGEQVAPLPTALLGATKPARAFIGHVEPTFDWTIRQRRTGQPLTSSICRALYPNLFHPAPVGCAFGECYDHVGELFAQWDQAVRAFNLAQDAGPTLLACQLAARDRQSMVILGDPTAVLPALPGGTP